MSIRLPNPRYIGDGLYARHDGGQLWVESSDGVRVLNAVAMDINTLTALNEYADYMADFYRNNQHQAPPGCDDCGANLTNYENPIAGAVKGEVYRVNDQDRYIEIRLCHDCARVIDEPSLQELAAKRTAYQQ